MKSLNTTLRSGDTVPGERPNPHVLVVEGSDEQYFFNAWMANLNHADNIDICRRRGSSAAISAFRSALKVADRKAVGLIVDADLDLIARWSDIAIELSKQYKNIPAAPDARGTILSREGGPNAGIWIMPDNRRAGEFEHFLTGAIRLNDPHWPLAQRYIADATSVVKLFDDEKMVKAEFRAWLAVRKNPGLLGEAVEAGDLDLTGEHIINLIDWLRRLFPGAGL